MRDELGCGILESNSTLGDVWLNHLRYLALRQPSTLLDIANNLTTEEGARQVDTIVDFKLSSE